MILLMVQKSCGHQLKGTSNLMLKSMINLKDFHKKNTADEKNSC